MKMLFEKWSCIEKSLLKLIPNEEQILKFNNDANVRIRRSVETKKLLLKNKQRQKRNPFYTIKHIHTHTHLIL